MSKASSVNETDATTRRIESGRLTKALSESMTVEPHAPAMYDVHHDDETYTVDVEGGSCECKDHQYRGDEFVCKHVIAASVRHAFAAEPNTALVARVLAAVRDHGCPHGETGCAGPTQLAERGYPCPACVAASGVGEWVVYQRLVERETPAGAPRAMTDGRRDEPEIVTDGGQPEPTMDDLRDRLGARADDVSESDLLCVLEDWQMAWGRGDDFDPAAHLDGMARGGLTSPSTRWEAGR